MQLDDPRFTRPKRFRPINWEHPFKTPGPLKQTCDTGAADCSRRCSSNLREANLACNNPDVSDKQACINDNANRAANCQTNCSAAFPPSFDCLF